MRILLYTTSYPPNISGVAVFVSSLAQFAVSHGHEVLVLTSAATGTPLAGTESIQDGVRVISLPSVPNPFHSKLTLSTPTGRRLSKIVDEYRPEVIHLNDPLPAGLMLARVAERRNIPVIATQHFSLELLTAYVPPWIGPAIDTGLGWWLRQLFSRCQLITCPSEKTAADLARWGIQVPVRVMSNGVEVARFAQPTATDAFRVQFKLPADEPILLFVGRVDRDKSIDVLIRSLAIVRAKRPARLVVVGGGDVKTSLQQLARQLGVGDAVTFTGRIPHDDPALPGLFQLADLFVMASIIETQGIVVIEAMAAGLPVVAANANALPELVTDGKTGRLAQPGDAAGFATAILELLDDPAARRRMGTAARQVAKQHEQSHCLAQFLSAYREIIH